MAAKPVPGLLALVSIDPYLTRSSPAFSSTLTDNNKKTLNLAGEGRRDVPLFLDRAKGETDLVLVEGLFDAAVPQSRGLRNVVAIGSAQIPAKQVETLKRHRVRSVTLCLDPDTAGTDGRISTLHALTKAGIRAYVSSDLPPGKDPDEFFLEVGEQGWRAHLKKARRGCLYLAEQILSRHNLNDVQAEADGSGRLVVGASKTDQEGQGAVLYLGAPTVTRVNAWLAAAGHQDGPLFRRVRRGGRVEGDPGRRLSVNAIRQIIRSRAAAVGIEGRVSGHSLRVGRAQSLAAGGASIVEMQTAGRWQHGAPSLASATVADKASSGAGADARVDVTAGNSGARRDKKGCIGSLYRSWRGPTVHARADSGISKCLPLDIWPISVHYLSPRRVPSGSGRAFCRDHATRRLTRERPRRGGGKRVGSAVHVHRCSRSSCKQRLSSNHCPRPPHRYRKARKHTEC